MPLSGNKPSVCNSKFDFPSTKVKGLIEWRVRNVRL